MSKKRERILIVDDDKLIRNILRVYLEEHDYDVEEAISGDAAVAIIKQHGQQHNFDLIILDQVMPGLDGLSTFQEVQKIDAKLPAIILTGYPTINLAIRFIQLGGINIVSKPFDPQSEVLVTTLREAINYAHIQLAQAAADQEESNEPFIFLDEGSETESNITYDETTWKVLIIDDDEAVHRSTKLSLDKFIFDGKTLEIHSTYSASEAKEWLNHHQDVALVIVDSTMETVFAGFDVIKHIRKTMGNRLIRIIFRTEQAGELPEQKVVIDQEIDGFLTKHDISTQGLTVMVTTILRAYRDLLIPERQRQEKIVELKVSNQIQKELQARIDELENQLTNHKSPSG
ncbi:MAG: response regulator [Candidatus Polarisedimenticolaceae bacterium]|nr:response regulator [Candidatus Polarisedimenticolaceae bacterium]